MLLGFQPAISSDYAAFRGTRDASEPKLWANSPILRSKSWEGPQLLAYEEVRTAALKPTIAAQQLPLKEKIEILGHISENLGFNG